MSEWRRKFRESSIFVQFAFCSAINVSVLHFIGFTLPYICVEQFWARCSHSGKPPSCYLFPFFFPPMLLLQCEGSLLSIISAIVLSRNIKFWRKQLVTFSAVIQTVSSIYIAVGTAMLSLLVFFEPGSEACLYSSFSLCILSTLLNIISTTGLYTERCRRTDECMEGYALYSTLKEEEGSDVTRTEVI